MAIAVMPANPPWHFTAGNKLMSKPFGIECGCAATAAGALAGRLPCSGYAELRARHPRNHDARCIGYPSLTICPGDDSFPHGPALHGVELSGEKSPAAGLCPHFGKR